VVDLRCVSGRPRYLIGSRSGWQSSKPAIVSIFGGGMAVGTSPLLLGFRWRPESATKFVHHGCEIRGVCRRENDYRLQVVGSPFCSMAFVRGHPEHLPLTFGAFPPLG
jgi:hypothetical protein